jgi:acyl-coenzyme A thioesterase 13
MKKNPLEILQQFVGKEVSQSPSPFTMWLKPRILSVELGKMAFQFTIRKEMTNPMGGLHGGVTAAIIDDMIGVTLFVYNDDTFYTTINNVIDYLSTAIENDVIIAETSIIRKGKQMVNAQCEIWNEDKTRLIAKGYSNLLKTTIKKE